MNFVHGNELTRAQGAVYSVNNLMQRICCMAAMRKSRSFISAFIVIVIAAVSCAKISDKRAAVSSAAVGPELRWKYETGG
jgi:hypothetical protein